MSRQMQDNRPPLDILNIEKLFLFFNGYKVDNLVLYSERPSYRNRQNTRALPRRTLENLYICYLSCKIQAPLLIR